MTVENLNGKKSQLNRRQKRALERQGLSAALTPEQRLQTLDTRFGAGVGAHKERAKLQALIQTQVLARKSDAKGKKS